jgi:O-glycosyl hydrolase
MNIDPRTKSGRFAMQAIADKIAALSMTCDNTNSSEEEVFDASNDRAVYKAILNDFQAELDFDGTKEPAWIARGKNITQLIKELGTYEDQNLEVRLTFDGGQTHRPISILTRRDGFAMLEYCGL